MLDGEGKQCCDRREGLRPMSQHELSLPFPYPTLTYGQRRESMVAVGRVRVNGRPAREKEKTMACLLQRYFSYLPLPLSLGQGFALAASAVGRG